MTKLFHWEVRTIDGAKPHYIFTVTDSLAEVELRLKDIWGDSKIKSIHRIGESLKFNSAQEVS